MAKGERDWAQLDAFEAEYAERLEAEKKRNGGNSQYLSFLHQRTQGRETFSSREVNAQDAETGRLFALRAKIVTLREKLAIANEASLLPIEQPYASVAARDGTARSWLDRSDEEREVLGRKKKGVRFLVDPAPPSFVYPVTFEEIKAVLAELPTEHAATVREIRLSNQKKTGADGDWLDGEIRLHCLVQEEEDAEIGPIYRRLMGRAENGADVERWGGDFAWGTGNKLYALWPRGAYKTFILRRVLIHEVAHGVAELPGMADAVRRAGSVEKFCERYAENFYRPPGRSVRLGY